MSGPIDRTRHIRRLDPRPLRGRLSISCDCGFVGWADECVHGRWRTGHEIEQELDRLFVEHLAPEERELYLLIDQRQVETTDHQGEAQLVARGNFIMPVGTPCLLTSWHEADGVRWGHYLVPETGQAGELPVGEVRTIDGQVLRLDCPA
jgi:hypothetical protein